MRKTRQDGIQSLPECGVKNIHYLPFDEKTLFAALRKVKTSTYLEISEEMEEKTVLQAAVLYFQKNRGVQLRVLRDVTDELSFVEFRNVIHSTVPLFADSVEIYYEDRRYPTIIISDFTKATQYLYEKVTGKTILYEDRRFAILTNLGESGAGGVTILKHISERDILEGWDKLGEMSLKDRSELGQKGEEQEIFLAKTALKVLMYCSIPEYRPYKFLRRRQLKGGKAGVKNRPKTPIFMTRFLPPVIYRIQRKNDVGHGIKKCPHMRIGHFRMLHADRYKEHKLIYVRPTLIHGGSLENKLYIARKP
jgi:hypothetical protein